MIDIVDTLRDRAGVASLIDHTLLKPDASAQDIARVCKEARDSQFASVCVNPYWVSFVAGALDGSTVAVCTVIGFPLGANRPATKLNEAVRALEEGAEELDMVVNIGALRSGDTNIVQEEIAAIAAEAHNRSALLKVIIETCLLDDGQKTAACSLAVDAGADFVKTSTGFAFGGATVEDVRLMRAAVGEKAGVKASGGIRDFAALAAMVHAGANRIGTGSGLAILAEFGAGATPESPKPTYAAKVPGGHEDIY